jgi:ribonuclease P protein component
MLPKKRRVNKGFFQKIMEGGYVIQGQFLIFRYLRPESARTILADSEVHLACVAPKNIAKSAVMRNKLRRRVYVILRPITISSGSGVFFYKKQGISASSQEIKEDIGFLLKKAHFVL